MTPVIITKGGEKCSPTRTVAKVFVKRSTITLKIFPETPSAPNFAKSNFLSTVSKAFRKSKKQRYSGFGPFPLQYL